MIKYKNRYIKKNKKGEWFIIQKQKFFNNGFALWHTKVDSYNHAKLRIDYENLLRK